MGQPRHPTCYREIGVREVDRAKVAARGVSL
jgi:hypothetical protein